MFEDHLFTKEPLRLPSPGTVAVQYPPMEHLYTDPDKVALVVAIYNFSIPADGYLEVDVNGRMISQVDNDGSSFI